MRGSINSVALPPVFRGVRRQTPEKTPGVATERGGGDRCASDKEFDGSTSVCPVIREKFASVATTVRLMIYAEPRIPHPKSSLRLMGR